MSEIAASNAALNSSASIDHNGLSEAIKANMKPDDSLRKLSPQTGLSIATLSRAINGKSIAITSILKLCTWLEKDINEFVVATATS